MSIKRSAEPSAVHSPAHVGRLFRLMPLTTLIQGLLAVLSVMVLSGPSVAQDLEPDRCYRALLTPELPGYGLEWPTSGAWSEGQVLVVDAYAGHVVRISRRGQVGSGLASTLPLEASGSQRPLARPSQIRAIDGGFLLEDEASDDILRLNSYLEVSESTPVKTSDVPYERSSIYGWSPMGEGFLAFGDLKGPRGWMSALFYFDKEGRLEIFYEVAIDAEVIDHYTRNTAYVAALGDVGYVLSVDETLSIGELRLGKGLRRLPSFPAEFKNRPKFDEAYRRRLRPHGARKATEIYRSYETATMASGLYAWGGRLYLVGKEAMASNGETDWWLIHIDPEDEGREKSRVRLPTGAAHLTIVPGSKFWALIEKGRVEGIGAKHAPFMDTASMVLVPTHWLENPNPGSPDEQLRVECVSLSP